MLYFIGLGLGDGRDITVKGLEIVRRCHKVYLESYTSVLTCGHEELERLYERPIILADRQLVEQESDVILTEAENGKDVAFLVVGDPFSATTHSDLALRAKQRNIPTRFIHNASILNAIGCCGLQLYRFGETVSIPFWEEEWKPQSFFDKICENHKRGLHTLCLLDIKVKEQSVENMMKGNKIFDPPRFMSVRQAAKQLCEIVKSRKSNGTESTTLNETVGCVGAARVGTDTQKLAYCTLEELQNVDMGPPLHSIVIIGTMHCVEEEALKNYIL